MEASLAKSAGPFLKLRQDSAADNPKSIDTSGQIERKPKGTSPWWSIEHGDANIRDPSGKFDIFAKSQVNYVEKLPSGHLIRFLFRTPPPASTLNATIQAHSGERGAAGFRAWALVVRPEGHLFITWTTCDLHSSNPAHQPHVRTLVEHTQLGSVRVGEWYVGQMVSNHHCCRKRSRRLFVGSVGNRGSRQRQAVGGSGGRAATPWVPAPVLAPREAACCGGSAACAG